MAFYKVEIDGRARKEIRRLPGNVRQRIIRILRSLEQKPRPYTSRDLDLEKAGIELESRSELRRIRVASWRVIYLIEDEWDLITVLAVRKRPPYQYDDLSDLLGN